MIRCRVCNKKRLIINKKHLAKHGLTKEDYVKRFPNAVLFSEEFSQMQQDHSRYISLETRIKGGRTGGSKRTERKTKACLRNLIKARNSESFLHQKKRGKIKISEEGRRIRSETGKKNIQKLVVDPLRLERCSNGGKRTHELHPEMAKENGKLVHLLYPNRQRLIGLRLAESGVLFKNSMPRFHFHADHYHRSKAEMLCCERLSLRFGDKLFSNVHIGRIEIDFVVVEKEKLENIEDWEHVIEYHPYSGYGEDNYEIKRTVQLREIGVKCLVSFITDYGGDVK